jgi:CheY-like chemotaxis protein
VFAFVSFTQLNISSSESTTRTFDDLTTEIAPNGLEGVQMYTEMMKQGKYYPLIIMDFHMPVMDGKQATKEIRKLEMEHNVPATHIVGLTADPEGKYDGMCVVLAKPIKKESFSKRIKEFLSTPCNCTNSTGESPDNTP